MSLTEAIIRLVLALGVLLAAAWSLKDPQRHIPFAFAWVFVLFSVALSQLLKQSKDATAFVADLALIVTGVACGLVLNESIRRYIAEKWRHQEA